MESRIAVSLRFGLAAAILMAVCGLSQAADKEKEPERIKATGTVVRVKIESGFWGIVGEGGKHYDPLGSLPREFRKDGLKVHFEATVEKDAASFHMWGKIIKIEKIGKAEKAE